jgi:hypothetical protein
MVRFIGKKKEETPVVPVVTHVPESPKETKQLPEIMEVEVTMSLLNQKLNYVIQALDNIRKDFEDLEIEN